MISVSTAPTTTEQVVQLWEAVRLCDAYFNACAEAWAKNEGRLASKEGDMVEGSDKIEALCNEAAEAVARLIYPEEFL